MNTRDKIVVLEHLPSRDSIAIIGTFDPLLRCHADRFRELRKDGFSVVALVVDSQAPLLPLQARLELVAALKDVDFVAAYDGESKLHAQTIHDDRERHAEWSSHFIGLVQRRTQS